MNYLHTQGDSEFNLIDNNEHHLLKNKINEYMSLEKKNIYYLLNKNNIPNDITNNSPYYYNQNPRNTNTRVNGFKKQTYDHFYPLKHYKNNSTNILSAQAHQQNINRNNSFINDFGDISEIKKTDSSFNETIDSSNLKINLLLQEDNLNKFINKYKNLNEKISSLNIEIIEKNKIINEFSSLILESKEKFEKLINKNQKEIEEMEIKHKNEINILNNKLYNLENENKILKINNNKLSNIIKKLKENNLNINISNKNIRENRIKENSIKRNLTSSRLESRVIITQNYDKNNNNNITPLLLKKCCIKRINASCRNTRCIGNQNNYYKNNLKLNDNYKNISYNSTKRGNSDMNIKIKKENKKINIKLSEGNINNIHNNIIQNKIKYNNNTLNNYFI